MATEVQETKKVDTNEVKKEPSRAGGRTTTFDRNKSRNNQRNNNKNQRRQNPDDVEKRIVSIRRVSHTYKGGKRMSLSVLVVVGDRKGKVGAAVGKGADVKSAETKAYNKAKKNMVTVTLHNTTIPHEILHKKGAVKIFMKPAAPGTGVIAGGPVRKVLEVAGVKDVLTKQLGTSNQIMNAYATFEALKSMKQRREK